MVEADEDGGTAQSCGGSAVTEAKPLTLVFTDEDGVSHDLAVGQVHEIPKRTRVLALSLLALAMDELDPEASDGIQTWGGQPYAGDPEGEITSPRAARFASDT